MQSDPNQKAEDLNKNEGNHVPTGGFVNINEIVRRRRELRNAEFNIADDSWDADLNVQPKEKPPGDSQ